MTVCLLPVYSATAISSATAIRLAVQQQLAKADVFPITYNKKLVFVGGLFCCHFGLTNEQEYERSNIVGKLLLLFGSEVLERMYPLPCF